MDILFRETSEKIRIVVATEVVQDPFEWEFQI